MHESDINLAKEVTSHLEGELKLIKDLANLDSSGISQKQEKRMIIRWLDKRDHFMHMVRFADSKICCFSSNNYEMEVSDGTPNKVWVASINKDPLSFVFQLEDPDSHNNVGFVFGMFGVNEETGLPQVMLNGVYNSLGNDTTSSLAILNQIEEMLSKPIRAEHQLLGSIYGGQIIGDLEGYKGEEIELTRLRALTSEEGDDTGEWKDWDDDPDFEENGYEDERDKFEEVGDGSENVQTKIYDDLGTQINKPTTFSAIDGQGVFHKKIKY